MRLTVVGSADAFNSAGRCHSCYLLEGDGFGPIMIDFGASALMGLRRAGRKATEIAGFAITHVHGDHLSGFPFLIIDAMFNDRRSAPLEVVGPVRTRVQIEDYMKVAYDEVLPIARPFETNITEIEPDQSAELAGATIRSFPAQHMSLPDRPLSLRIVAPDGRYVTFSGDTAMNDRLIEAAEGAEVLVAECTGLAPPIGKHCSWQEWEAVLPTVKAKRVLFSHLDQGVRDAAPDLVKNAPVGPPIQFADDGLILDL